MMAAATANHAAKIQEMQLISRLHSFRNVAYKSFQSASATEYPGKHVTRIHLGQPSGRQFQHVVSRVIGQDAHDHYVPGAWRSVRANDRKYSRQVKRRSS